MVQHKEKFMTSKRNKVLQIRLTSRKKDDKNDKNLEKKGKRNREKNEPKKLEKLEELIRNDRKIKFFPGSASSYLENGRNVQKNKKKKKIFSRKSFFKSELETNLLKRRNGGGGKSSNVVIYLGQSWLKATVSNGGDQKGWPVEILGIKMKSR